MRCNVNKDHFFLKSDIDLMIFRNMNSKIRILEFFVVVDRNKNGFLKIAHIRRKLS